MYVPNKVSTIKIITPNTIEMARVVAEVAEFDGGLPEENPFANSQKDYKSKLIEIFFLQNCLPRSSLLTFIFIEGT